jgi:competence protein ComEA
MDEEAKNTPSAQKKVTSAVLVTAACVVAGVIVSQLKPEKPDLLAGTTPRPVSPIATPITAPVSPAPTPVSKKIVVHVTGAVKSSGVFEFAPDARVKDAITRAGGAWSNADLSGLNLAAKLVDGSQLRVPKIGTVAKAPQETSQRTRPSAPPRLDGVAPMPVAVPPAYQAAVEPVYSTNSAPNPVPAKSPRSSGTKKAPSAPIAINTATAEELAQLPGVGPSTAAAILAYRQERGGFSSIDELNEVKGIGPKKLEKMRPYVRL